MRSQFLLFRISCLIVQFIISASVPLKDDFITVLNFNVHEKDLNKGADVFNAGVKSGEALLCKAPARSLNEKFSIDFKRSIEENQSPIVALINVVSDDNNNKVQIPVIVLKDNEPTGGLGGVLSFINSFIQGFQNSEKPVSPNNDPTPAQAPAGGLDLGNFISTTFENVLNTFNNAVSSAASTMQQNFISAFGPSANSINSAAPGNNSLVADMFNSLNITTTTVRESSTKPTTVLPVNKQESTTEVVEKVDAILSNEKKPSIVKEEDEVVKLEVIEELVKPSIVLSSKPVVEKIPVKVVTEKVNKEDKNAVVSEKISEVKPVVVTETKPIEEKDKLPEHSKPPPPVVSDEKVVKKESVETKPLESIAVVKPIDPTVTSKPKESEVASKPSTTLKPEVVVKTSEPPKVVTSLKPESTVEVSEPPKLVTTSKPEVSVGVEQSKPEKVETKPPIKPTVSSTSEKNEPIISEDRLL